MIEMSANVRISRRADVVFDYLADMANNPLWQNGMSSCHWTSEPPIAVGSTYSQVAKFLWMEILTEFEVVEFVPGSSIRIVSTKSTFPLDITRTVKAVSDNLTEVQAYIKGEPAGMMGVLAPLTRPLANRSVQRDYAGLKDLLESS